MIDRENFRKSLENATLDELIKKRDEIMLEIRRYEKDNELRDAISMNPLPNSCIS